MAPHSVELVQRGQKIACRKCLRILVHGPSGAHEVLLRRLSAHHPTQFVATVSNFRRPNNVSRPFKRFPGQSWSAFVNLVSELPKHGGGVGDCPYTISGSTAPLSKACVVNRMRSVNLGFRAPIGSVSGHYACGAWLHDLFEMKSSKGFHSIQPREMFVIG